MAEIAFQLIRSNRKTVSIQIQPDGTVVVRCPRTMRIETVRGFVRSKADWIEKHQKTKQQAAKQAPFTMTEIRALADEACRLIPERVRWFAPVVGVTYGRITIRNQRTRWGSCSSQGNLNFNCLLMLMPREVLDYVVVHELCHRKHMDHSAAFWAEVERVLPDYKLRRKWLKDNGNAFISRMP